MHCRAFSIGLFLLGVVGTGCDNNPSDGPPRPQSIEPSTALVDTQVEVIIVGEQFNPSSYLSYTDESKSKIDVSFSAYLGSRPLEAVKFVDTKTLTATVPPGLPVGTYDLRVVNPEGQEGSLPNAFRIAATPTSTDPDTDTGDELDTSTASESDSETGIIALGDTDSETDTSALVDTDSETYIESFICDSDETCSESCPTGHCSIDCQSTNTCFLNCDVAGECDMTCAGPGICYLDCIDGNCSAFSVSDNLLDLDCFGGACDLHCTGTGNCVLNCESGGCLMDCPGTGRCLLNCPPGDCTLTGCPTTITPCGGGVEVCNGSC